MMLRFLLARMQQSLVLLFLATLVAFGLLHMIPGDPALVLLGDMAKPEDVVALRQALGLDKPLPVQYGVYVARLIRGDFGISLRARRPVLEVIGERVIPTFQLAAAASFLAIAAGIPVGVLSAVRRGSFVETLAFVASLAGQAMPGYWLGLLLMNIFAVRLGLLPVSGSGSIGHLILPAVTLSAFMLGLIVRLTRSAMLEVMIEDYVRTARAKGLPELTVLVRHALRTALIPVVTVVGLQVGTLLGGAVVTETIFAWPGVGSLAVLAILQRDYAVVQSIVLLSAVTFIVINFAVDVIYVFLDPRVAYA